MNLNQVGVIKSVEDDKNYQLYEKLREIFEQMELNKILAITALALERLWKSFVDGIEKTEYTTKEKEDFLQMEKLRMDMIWERVKTGRVNPKHLSIFNETMKREYELTSADRNTFGAELDERAIYLDSELIQISRSFFTKSKFDIEQCAITVSSVVSSIMCEIDNILYFNFYEKSSQIYEINSKLTQYIKNNHSTVLEELQRVETDMELAQRYPQNIDKILQKRMEYHELNICDINLLEDALIREKLKEEIKR